MIYVLKDATFFGGDAKRSLEHIIRTCHDGELNGEIIDEVSKVNSLLSLLTTELSNSNKEVRETVQSLFSVLADLKNKTLTELLLPVKDRLLAPIFTKPLRALPYNFQIGHVDAVTYCLYLPGFLNNTEELFRLIQEALAFTDAEDSSSGVSKFSQSKSASSVISLRVVCIKMLTAVMRSAEFLGSREATTRARIIAVFFKSVYCKSPEVIEIALIGTIV